VEATVSITVISGASVLSAVMTTTQGAGGAHAITGGSVTDDYAAASQGRSRHCFTARSHAAARSRRRKSRMSFGILALIKRA
jgi:hypothetical protein